MWVQDRCTATLCIHPALRAESFLSAAMQRSIRNRYRQGIGGTVRRIRPRRCRMARIDERLYKRSHKRAQLSPMPEVLSSRLRASHERRTAAPPRAVVSSRCSAEDTEKHVATLQADMVAGRVTSAQLVHA